MWVENVRGRQRKEEKKRVEKEGRRGGKEGEGKGRTSRMRGEEREGDPNSPNPGR